MANLLLRGALILLLFPTVVNTESHWESYADWATGYVWSCYPYSFTYCSDWYSYPYYLGYNDCTCSLYQPYSGVCNQAVGKNCYTNCIGWKLVTRWRCQYGWKGANCDIPICDNPVCSVDQICVRPFTCECPQSSTGECIYQPCDDGERNCYPGFCDKTRSPWKCLCPAGFKGPNCQTITNTPEIKSCYVQIFGTPDGQAEQEVARSNECAAPGLDPLPVWIGSRAANRLTKIVVNWEAHYVNQQPLPGRGRAPYILDAPVPIGIVETKFTISFPNETRFTPQSTYCIGPDPVYDNPPTIKQCNGKLKQWTDLDLSSIVKTNDSFVIAIEAQVGGVKKGDNNWPGGRFTTPQRISMDPSMNTTIRTTKFAFDLEPPYHCLSKSNNCSVFPIFLNRSMTSDPVIQPTFNDWHDDGSGIDRFYVEVYYMQPDSQNLLIPVGAPLRAENINITLNNFRFTCPNPGAYSIVLTVYDKANNSAKARKIFNYDNHDSSFYETTTPIHLSAADPNTGHKFITRLERPVYGTSPYQFNVIWDRHFANSNNEDWLRGVRPWPLAPNQIDDNRGSTYGLRSIDSLTRETGVSGYELAYAVDNRVEAVAPSTFAVITERSTTSFPISISSTLKDGDTIVVWLRVHDLYGKSKLIVTKTYVDTSRFNIEVKKQEFVKHCPDQFNSSVVIDVASKISGIKNITYEIYDTSKQLSIRIATVLPQVLQRTIVLLIDPTCYCIPLGYCYNRTQLINIDNCWLDRFTGDQIRVKYTIYSLSGWGLDAEINAGTLSQEDIPCRSYRPTGPPGQGPQGYTGPPGPIGATGYTGIQGSQGWTGATGSLGLTGFPGATGGTGNTGSSGIQGSQGWTGATGSSGLTGFPGATGGMGNTGSSGIQGSQGWTGSSGATGPVGPTGPLGRPGEIGLTGSSGYPGPIGSAGPMGNPGATGSSGATGQTGGTGATGNPGPFGGNGATGALGPPGPWGAPGPQGYKGDTGSTGRDGGPGPAGNIGVKGDPGANGTDGRFGSTGATGASGSPGYPGPPGPPGPGQGAAGLSSGPEDREQPQSQEPSGTSSELKYGLIAVAVVCAVNFLLVVGLTLWSRSQRMKHATAAADADTEIQDADDFDTKSQSCDVSHDADQVSS